jgi:apolipoprotein N-acyltransferase
MEPTHLPIAPRSLPLWLNWTEIAPRLLTFVTAALLTFSFPPFPLYFLIYIAWVPMLWVFESQCIPNSDLRRGTHRRDGWRGTWRFFRFYYPAIVVWNLACCYWLMFTAWSVDSTGEAIEALIAGLMASIANPVVMYTAFYAFYLCRVRWGRFPAYLAWVGFYLTFEFLDYRWDLTWSWLNLGHAPTYFPWYIQHHEWTGILGTSLQILLVNVLVFEAVCRALEARQAGCLPRTRRLFRGALLLLVLPLGATALLIWPSREAFRSSGSLNVRVVQPVIDPRNKFRDMTPDDQMRLFIRLAEAPGIDTIDLVVLPETALPYVVREDDLANDGQVRLLGSFARKHGLSILTGCMPQYVYQKGERIQASTRTVLEGSDTISYDIFNGAIVINSPVHEVYHKGKLVPFTERAPFLSLLGEQEIDLGGGVGGFGLPDTTYPLTLHTGVKINPMICYESQFGEYAAGQVQKGAQLSAIISNDVWFGPTSGYIQHAYFSVLRAIETRRDIARSANTGMSLFCNSMGHTSDHLTWWKQGIIDKKLNLYTYQTFYVRYGDYIGRIVTVLSLAFLGYTLVRRSRLRSSGS